MRAPAYPDEAWTPMKDTDAASECPNGLRPPALRAFTFDESEPSGTMRCGPCPLTTCLLRSVILIAATLSLGACSPTIKLEDIQSNAAGALKAIPTTAQALIPKPIKPPKGSATEVYTRIARGAMKCWLGPERPLNGSHLFQAEAKPRSQGGAARIDIHERIAEAPNQPGRRVFSVLIDPVGPNASVRSENLALPAPLAEAMTEDANMWAAKEESCIAGQPQLPEPPPDIAAPGDIPPQPVVTNARQ